MSTLFASVALQHDLQDSPALADVEVRFGTTVEIAAWIDAGEPFDVVIATASALRAADRVDDASIAPLTTTYVGLALSGGSTHPPLEGHDAWVAQLRTGVVAHSATGASGLAFARLASALGGIRTIAVDGFSGQAVLDGRADMAVQMTTELAMVPGIDVVGTFPPSLLPPTEFEIARAVGSGATASNIVNLCTNVRFGHFVV
jgi:molybdate transport system substrate-binding protein